MPSIHLSGTSTWQCSWCGGLAMFIYEASSCFPFQVVRRTLSQPSNLWGRAAGISEFDWVPSPASAKRKRTGHCLHTSNWLHHPSAGTRGSSRGWTSNISPSKRRPQDLQLCVPLWLCHAVKALGKVLLCWPSLGSGH